MYEEVDTPEVEVPKFTAPSIITALSLMAGMKATAKLRQQMEQMKKQKALEEREAFEQLPHNIFNMQGVPLPGPKKPDFSYKLAEDMAKIAASAKGIPDRTDFGDHQQLPINDLVRMVVQQHHAQRAGLHSDLRLGTPDTGLHSWAVRKGMPTPGNKHLAVQQPVHDYGYGDFEGTILQGYGAGKVKKQKDEQALVTKVTPDAIHFTTGQSREAERYALIRSADQKRWLLINTTSTQPIPYNKVHYTSVPEDKVEDILKNLGQGSSVQAKIDGAASLTQLTKDKAEVLSYRAAKSGKPIVHTERMFGGRPELQTPKDLIGTILRGELYGVGEGGKAIPPQELGGILNSGVAKAINTQRDRKIDLKNLLFDIQQLGKNTISQSVPYAERMKMIKDIMARANLDPNKFVLPPEAKTPEEALKMWHDVRSGNNPLTNEGIVIHPPTGKPMKSKLMDEHDVHVTGVFPGKGKYTGIGAGGFNYSNEPGGPVVGEVGTGLTDDMRKTLWESPADFIGRIARVKSQQKLPSGALRAPSLIALHEDYPAAQARTTKSPILNQLLQAKAHSDVRQYQQKHQIMSKLMNETPNDFVIDSTMGNMLGVTHPKTGFKIHVPIEVVPQGLASKYQHIISGNVQSPKLMKSVLPLA